MSFRGRGRGGRGYGGYGGGGYRPGKQEPFELFPEIACLGVVKYSDEEVKKYARFVKWSRNLQNFFEASPYYYEDRSQRLEKVLKKSDIERYSDKKLQATKVKQPLWHLIKMGPDHMPAELARGDKRVTKKIRWDDSLDFNKLDAFEKLEQKHQGQEGEDKEEKEGKANKENEEDGEEDIDLEDDEEYSDEGDYEQGEYCDDDEDDFNIVEEIEEAEY